MARNRIPDIRQSVVGGFEKRLFPIYDIFNIQVR